MINEEIRELLRSLPAVAVVEDGRPAYVITSYDAWRQLAAAQPVRISNGRPGHLAARPADAVHGPADSQESAVLERLNKEILSLREQIRMQEEQSVEADLI